MGELVIHPQNDRVLVEPISVENKTKSGLVIVAGEERISTTFAKILAVAETLKDSYKRGEIVFYNGNAGAKFRLGGKNLILLTKGEVLAKIEVDDLSEAINVQDLA